MQGAAWLIAARYEYEVSGSLPAWVWLLWAAVVIVSIAAVWKVFEKAGRPGWWAIIPFWNVIVLCQIAGRPAWWVLLLLIPFVNVVVAFIVGIDTARAFGKGTGFGVGLVLLGIVFYPILGFGSATYRGAPPRP